MKRRFKVVFNREKCKGCELCINFCPKRELHRLRKLRNDVSGLLYQHLSVRGG